MGILNEHITPHVSLQDYLVFRGFHKDITIVGDTSYELQGERKSICVIIYSSGNRNYYNVLIYWDDNSDHCIYYSEEEVMGVVEEWLD